MKIMEMFIMLTAGITAVSLAVVAVQAVRLTTQMNLLLQLLRAYLSRDDHHPPHHYLFVPQDLLIWEWREGSWRLRTTGVSPESAGPPPGRPGTYDGECVTTRRASTGRAGPS